MADDTLLIDNQDAPELKNPAITATSYDSAEVFTKPYIASDTVNSWPPANHKGNIDEGQQVFVDQIQALHLEDGSTVWMARVAPDSMFTDIAGGWVVFSSVEDDGESGTYFGQGDQGIATYEAMVAKTVKKPAKHVSKGGVSKITGKPTPAGIPYGKAAKAGMGIVLPLIALAGLAWLWNNHLSPRHKGRA